MDRFVRCACACGCLIVFALPAHADRAWPALDFPPDARSWSVGDGPLELHGVPTRIRGFVSAHSLDEVARFLRQRLGGPVVESRLGDRLILGRAAAGFYLTVQLESTAAGTRALVAVADLARATRQRQQAQDLAQRWLRRLPAGSGLLSHTSARDGERLSSQWVFSNGASGALNGQALVALMRADGLRLEREARPPTRADERLLWFRGTGKEATAFIGRLPDGRASLVLNTVTVLEALP